MNPRALLGIAAIVAGLVLCLFFRDAHWEWFEGGWLGVALIVLGLFDLFDNARRARGHRPRSVMDDLRSDFGRDARELREDFGRDFGRDLGGRKRDDDDRN